VLWLPGFPKADALLAPVLLMCEPRLQQAVSERT
jgi:hypothetical protein